MNFTDKPFACTFVGCNMSFTNEDHLAVHKTKHNMMLNLDGGKPTNFIDQTPTPTRFMRICEEVGLFQELQNVNPFDETFRKAVESGKLESLAVNDINDDTLHTPQVFPHLDVGADKRMDSSVIVNDSTNFNNNKEENNSNITTIVNSAISAKNTRTIVIQEEENLLVAATSSFDNEQQLDNDELQQHQRSQKFIPENHELLQRYADTESSDILWSHSSTKTQLHLVDDNNTCYYENSEENENYSSTISTSLNNVNHKPKDVKKKLDILERNRASSMRARAKRKAWIEELETSMNKVNSLNMALQTEVNALRFEVANLKTLLLAHENCPVTKAMAGTNLKSSKLIPIIPQVSAPIAIINSSHEDAKKILIRNQLSINSKRRKKLPVSSVKNTILLPKINQSGPVTTKIERYPCTNLKITDVQVLTGKSQKLLIMKKPTLPKNINYQVSKDHIPIEPSRQLIYLTNNTDT